MDDTRTLIERALTYRWTPVTEALATVVVGWALIESAWAMFEGVMGFLAALSLLPSAGLGDPALWRWPVALLTANIFVKALWSYHINNARRAAAALTVLGGLGTWALFGASRGYFALGLLAIAVWWMLPDSYEWAGGYTAGCTPKAHSCGHPHHRADG